MDRFPRSVESQAPLRRPKGAPYRCFLPDLTGFEGLRRAGPNLQHSSIIDPVIFVTCDPINYVLRSNVIGLQQIVKVAGRARAAGLNHLHLHQHNQTAPQNVKRLSGKLGGTRRKVIPRRIKEQH